MARTATNPETGEKIVYNEASGAWEPMAVTPPDQLTMEQIQQGPQQPLELGPVAQIMNFLSGTETAPRDRIPLPVTEEDITQLGTATGGFGRGMTLGALDPLAAMQSSGVPVGGPLPIVSGLANLTARRFLPQTGPAPGDTFEVALDRQRRIREAEAERFPKTQIASEIAGSLPLAFGVGTLKPVQQALRAAPIRTSGKIGAGFGAGEGLFGAERLEDIPEDVLIKALFGGMLGLGTGAATEKILSPVTRSVFNRLTGRTAKAPAEQVVREELESVFSGANPIINELRRLGPQGRLMDISAPTRGLAIGTAMKSPVARQKMEDVLSRRAAGSSSRIKSILRSQFGAKGKTFSEFLENTLNRRAQEAGPLYEAAREKIISAQSIDDLTRFADDIASGERLSGHPAAQGAIRQLKNSLFRKVGGESVPKTSVDGIDAARETFGQKIFKLRQDKKIGPRLYEELVKVRNKFDDILPEEYVQANRIYSSDSKVADAFNAGKDFFKLGDDQLIDLQGTMSAADRDAFIAGLGKSIANKIGKKTPTSKIPRALETEEFADKLKLVLPDDVADNFIRSIETEGIFSATRNAVVGGSQTALNQQAIQRVTGKTSRAIPLSREGVASMLMTRQNMTEDVANEIADILTKQMTPAQIEALMRQPVNLTGAAAGVAAQTQ